MSTKKERIAQVALGTIPEGVVVEVPGIKYGAGPKTIFYYTHRTGYWGYNWYPTKSYMLALPVNQRHQLDQAYIEQGPATHEDS